MASLREKQALAGKIQLKDNRCPVCDSKVEKLNPLFQEEHLKQEIELIGEQIALTDKERVMYNQKRVEFSQKLQKAREAEDNIKGSFYQRLPRHKKNPRRNKFKEAKHSKNSFNN